MLLTLNYKVNDWAKFMVRSGYDYYGKSRLNKIRSEIWNTGGFEDFGGFDSKGKYMKADCDGFATTNDAIFTAKKNFGDWGVDGLLGGLFSTARIII
jgi:hypothetical protein